MTVIFHPHPKRPPWLVLGVVSAISSLVSFAGGAYLSGGLFAILTIFFFDAGER